MRFALLSHAFLSICISLSSTAWAAATETVLLDRLLEAGKFAELDQHVNGLQRRYEAGELSDKDVADVVEVFFRAIPGWEGQFDRWVEAYPDSYAARYARGLYLVALGWGHRGEGYAKETSSVQFGQFRRLLEKGKADLRRSLELTTKPVLSLRHLIALEIGGGTRSMADEYHAKAIAVDPRALTPRRMYFWGLQPKWGGSVESLDGYLARARADALPAAVLSTLEADYWQFMSDAADVGGDLGKALEHAERSVRSGAFASAFEERGRIHLRREDHDKAIADLGTAIDKRPLRVKVYRLRALAYDRSRRPAEAVADYRIAAERGDVFSQNRLGGAFNNAELGLKKDYAEAFRWYRMAAELSDPWAQAYVGDMYYNGEGVKRNHAEAAKWLRASASQENPAGQTVLAVMLWYGHGMPQDTDEAIRLWRIAAKKGEASAKRNLDHLLSATQRMKVHILDFMDAIPRPW